MKRTHRKALWAWVGVISVACLAVLVVALQQSGSDVRAGGIALGFWFPVAVTVLGALIALRQPGNRIAWLLMGFGLAVVVELFLQLFLSSQPESPLLVHVVAVVLVHAALPMALYLAFLIPWMFPDGRFYMRWQQVAWLPGAVVLSAVPLTALFTEMIGQPYPAEGEAWVVENPIGFLPSWVLDLAVYSGILVLVLMAGSGIVSLSLRYRSSSVVARAQIRWIAFSISIVAAVLVLIVVTDASQNAMGGFLLVTAFTSMPICMAVAITRYRLFEIDRLISRTVSYTLVAAILGLVFAAGAIWIPAALELGDGPLLVAASTLAAAALFNPLRRRIQRAVDRRFNRSRYQAENVAEEFATQMQASLTLRQLADVWMRTVDTHFEPAVSGVWLKDDHPENPAP